MELDDPGRRRITLALAGVILSAWVISFARDMLDKNYDIPGELSGLMVLLAGWCFVDRTIKGLMSASDEEQPSER